MTPLLRLAQAVLDGSDAQARELATRIFDRDARAKRQRKVIVRAKPKAPRNETKALRRESRPERIAKIREAVFAKWVGQCAVCWGRVGAAATDLHHLLSGPERRWYESTETTLPVCAQHHTELHRGDLEALERALRVCIVNEMTLAERALTKRIAKVNEARAVRAPGGT